MIKIENVAVYNIARAVYSARNAMNSWDRSDSDIEHDILGENDLDLAKRLVKSGTEHRKFLRMITVTMDITAPLYWWKEYDTYKVGTVCNSCSTMHTLHKRELTADDFSTEHFDTGHGRYMLEKTIAHLNALRTSYLETKDKGYWYEMICLLPSCFNQKRTVQLNYEVALNIIRQRSNHKLDEWHTLCDTLRELPYVEELVYAVD